MPYKDNNSPAAKASQKRRTAKWYQSHKAQASKAEKQFRKKNPHYQRDWWRRDPEYRRNSDYKSKYGITLEDYNKMFEAQNGCCAICGRNQMLLKTKLAIDHYHSNGKVRGLLCMQCNQALGLLKDNPTILRKAADYLEK